ncbi:MAG: glycoside hydrolase family 25 protein [Roseburia sp.]|nr:glycoside hydrolase family 25 protein [Ruminococcus sp.]MCM1154220.1 glycoside hydrolase family 25 protein [Roseburia sp.]MCM1241346.1 glycoside hydrolase family 25 protein [Roseburia sp.]
MDSKKLRRTLFIVIMMFFMITVVVMVANWEIVQEKLGIDTKTQSVEPVMAETETEDKQIGSDLHAFMYDETFFDSDTHYKSIETYSGRSVSLIMSSVAKDLRIMVVNSSGALVNGVPFSITVQGVGEYTDDDQDGVIYIDKLRAGEYSVYMNEIEGYRVPNTVTTIKVKQDIEYRVLEDIEYLMLTENDIDASKEDTEERGAEQDADGTENTAFETLSDSVKKGIDVSKWNQTIDWEAVKEDGVEFAIIRCGYRGSSSGSLIIDPMYEQNIEGAIEAGIPVGVYFFTQALNEVEAVEEASMVINLIRKYDVDYPVFLDSESAGGNGRADSLTAAERTSIHKAFLETIASAGYATGIYGSTNWLNARVQMKELSSYHTWLAEYADIPTYEEYYHMWQYTSKGTIEGISTNVDLNLCYMNIDTSIDHSAASGGYTGVVNGDTGNVPIESGD